MTDVHWLAVVLVVVIATYARFTAHGVSRSPGASSSTVKTGPKWEQDVLIPMQDIEQEDDL